MKLIQVTIDDELAVQLKHLAVDKGTNVSELVRAALAGLLLEETTK